jgi:AraC-like DNA-binding protein
MSGFAEVFRVAGAALSVLLAAVLLRDHPRDSSARASAFLLAGVVGHLLFPLVLTSGANLALQHGTLLLGMSAPFALWLLAQVHFDDAFRPRPGHWVLLAVAVGIGYLSWLGVMERRIPGAWFSPANADFWQVAPRLVSLALVAHALIRVYVGAGSDLVLARLRLRYALLLVAGTYMLIELLGELVLRDSPSARIADTLHSALVLVIVFGASLVTLRSSPEALRPAKVGLDGPAADPALLDRLRRVMEEGAYRQEGLSIRGLAERVGTQEHKLRQMINAELGFKNFNAFLHHYRIREAQQALTDPARAHLGVAQIAYEVGYRSLGTFNKAFKDVTGRTPTEIRSSG